MAKVLYTAKALSTGAREGHAETDDKNLVVDFSAPGSGKPGTNPEQLFACGYAACYGGALAYMARQQKLDIGVPTIHSEVALNQDDNGFFISAVLDVQLPNLDAAQAEALARAAHAFCPYSKATKGNIDVVLKLNGKAL